MRLPPLPRRGLLLGRIISPVVLGRQTLAYLWVLESTRAMDDLDFMSIERAANAIALQMMKEKAAAEAKYKLRSDLVTELVSGRHGPGETILRRAAYFGINLRVPRAVLVVRSDEGDRPSSWDQAEERAIALRTKIFGIVERACGQRSPSSIASAKSDEVIILAATAATEEAGRRAELRRLADFLREEIERWLPELTVSVGIGNRCERLEEYPESYDRACRAIGAVKASGESNQTMASYELGIYDMLLDPANRSKVVALVDDTIGRLLDYDRAHKTELVRTLEQYLLHDGHHEQTAAALCIHLSTLRYRLQRIEQLAPLDLGDVEAKLNLHLAVKVLRALNSSLP